MYSIKACLTCLGNSKETIGDGTKKVRAMVEEVEVIRMKPVSPGWLV